MKNILSIIISMLLVSAITLTGFAVDHQDKKTGGTSNPKKPDQEPGPNDPPEPPEDPYEHIKLNCAVTVAGVVWSKSSYESSKWNFYAHATNNTGMLIPKYAKIEYVFNGTLGDFETSTGYSTIKKGLITLSSPLAINGKAYLGMAVFLTKQNPAQVTCSAYYLKKK